MEHTCQTALSCFFFKMWEQSQIVVHHTDLLIIKETIQFKSSVLLSAEIEHHHPVLVQDEVALVSCWQAVVHAHSTRPCSQHYTTLTALYHAHSTIPCSYSWRKAYVVVAAEWAWLTTLQQTMYCHGSKVAVCDFLIHVGTSNNSFTYGHRVHMKYSSRTSSTYLSTAQWRVGLWPHYPHTLPHMCWGTRQPDAPTWL